MNLMEKIHQRWAGAEGLCALLPAARVFTGASPDVHTPAATIVKTSEKPDAYQSDGSAIDRVTLRFRVVHERYEQAAAIVHEMKKTFDRSAFDLDDGDRVLDMQRANDCEQQRDDGLWEMTVDFQCTVYLASGV